MPRKPSTIKIHYKKRAYIIFDKTMQILQTHASSYQGNDEIDKNILLQLYILYFDESPTSAIFDSNLSSFKIRTNVHIIYRKSQYVDFPIEPHKRWFKMTLGDIPEHILEDFYLFYPEFEPYFHLRVQLGYLAKFLSLFATFRNVNLYTFPTDWRNDESLVKSTESELQQAGFKNTSKNIADYLTMMVATAIEYKFITKWICNISHLLRIIKSEKLETHQTESIRNSTADLLQTFKPEFVANVIKFPKSDLKKLENDSLDRFIKKNPILIMEMMQIRNLKSLALMRLKITEL